RSRCGPVGPGTGHRRVRTADHRLAAPAAPEPTPHRRNGRPRSDTVRARLKAFGAFWYDFIIGDDWTVAAGIVIALIITGVVATTAIPGWWIRAGAIPRRLS